MGVVTKAITLKTPVIECYGDSATVMPSSSCPRATGVLFWLAFRQRYATGKSGQHHIRFGNNKLGVAAEGH
jgi:hypothetical protein